MDVKASGIVTRSGRRLSTDKLEGDTSSVNSTPTKRRTRRLSAKPELEDLPETDIIDKEEKSVVKSVSEPIKKEILALTINDTSSPNRNLRKRNISLSSPKEATKPIDNATPKNAVRKIESSLMQNIVDSPKIRKNKRLSGSDTEGLQDVSLRRSRRLSGELNVVLEDPIREDQDASKVNSNRRGRRRTIVPEHPILHEECEDVEESAQTEVKVDPPKDSKSPRITVTSDDNSQENIPTLSVNLERSNALIFSTSEILDDSSNENFGPKCFSPITPKLHVSEVKENTPQKKADKSSLDCSQMENETLFDNTNYGSQNETPISIKKRFSDADSKSSEKKKLRKSEELTHSRNITENTQEEDVGDSSSLNMSSNDVSLEGSKPSSQDETKNEASQFLFNTSQRKSPRLSGRFSSSPNVNMNSSKTKITIDDAKKISSPKKDVLVPQKNDEEKSFTDSTTIGLNTSGKNVVDGDYLLMPSSTKESDEVNFDPLSSPTNLNNSRKKNNSESSPVVVLNSSRTKRNSESSPSKSLNNSRKGDNRVSSPVINLNNSMNDSGSSAIINLNISQEKDSRESSPMIDFNTSGKKDNTVSSPMISLNNSRIKDNTVTSPLINFKNSPKKNNRESSPIIDLNTSGKKDDIVSSPMISLNNSRKKSNRESLPMTDLNTSGKMDNTVSSPMIDLNNSRKKNNSESSPMIDLNISDKKDNTVTSPLINLKNSLKKSNRESSPMTDLNNSRRKNNRESSPMIDLNTSDKKNENESSPMINLNNSRKKNTNESSLIIDLNTSGKKDDTVSSPMINLNNSRKKNNSESSPVTDLNTSSKKGNSPSSPMINLNNSRKKNNSESSPMIHLNTSGNKGNSPSSPMISLNYSHKKNTSESSPTMNLNKSRNKNTSESSPIVSMISSSQEIAEESSSSSEPNSPRKNDFEIENALKQNNSIIKSTSFALKCDSQILYTGSSESKEKMVDSDTEESDSDNEQNENDYVKLQLIDESASEAGSDYKSGDSLNGSELEEMELNEIVEKGESLHSEDEEESDVSSYEKDSFICSDGEQSDASSKSNTSDIENNTPTNVVKETTKQTVPEEWVVSSLDSPLKSFNGKDLGGSRKQETSSENKDGGWTSSAGNFKIVEKVVVEKPTQPVTTSNYGSTTRFNIVTLKKNPKHILSMPPGLDNFKENALYGNNVKRKDSKNYKILQQKMKALNRHK